MIPRLHTSLCLLTLLLVSCKRGPSRGEALGALRSIRPAIDSVPVAAVVWRDGPPWFSCAEIVTKLRSGADSAAVRLQVGNWHDLVRAGWIIMRDTASGPVADPGWCAAQLTPLGAPQALGWAPRDVPGFPTGASRRGWTVPVGIARVLVAKSPRASSDSEATVDYLRAVTPNANGRALGAARDTLRSTVAIVRRDGRWVVRGPVSLAR